MADQEVLLYAWEVAALFGVHPATIRRWRRQRGLPWEMQPSGMIVYPKSKVITWAREQVARLRKGAA